ncbi:NAD-dependent epimerase/dehydratase family protein [Caulobacter mirabilis]|uniref:NAD-dependent dehydratase n=1 Tax=Caulobacter mirabilis TaxID=69666 RepID=A0A2D2ATG8_9CAUL|nr:NAD-dependent epimerase/dehydratase family protein [Caulobacter mirabilis]ATQ41308.1 NAD-dependent dehydratase [Caulobacter mirabilis]
MTVLVLGGTGFIGGPVVRRLTEVGETVALHRGGRSAPAGAVNLVADRGDPRAVLAGVRAHRVTTVVDMMAMTEADTLPLFEVLAGEIGRYVLASSADVYRNYEGLHRKAAPEPIREPLAEDSPLRTTRHPYRLTEPRAADDPQKMFDDYDKIPLEQALLAQSGFDGTVARLPMVFGPGDRQRRFAWLIAPMAAGRAEIAAPAAWLDWRTSYGFVEDVAAGLALAATHPAAGGRVYNIGPAEPLSHRDWAARLADVMRWEGRLVEAGEPSGPLAGLDLAYPLVTDTARIRAELGYEEAMAPGEALRLTIADELAREG